ncbi:MAG TPA: hypothetical protein VGM73_18105 [Candidatus Didemnitutus sp.]|jgi:hypothetical protein
MHKRSSRLFVITLGLLTAASAWGADRWETLKAINLVENPTNQTRVGPRGELGPYQFRSATWKMHTQKPFDMANDRSSSDAVAVAHYEWIRHGLGEAGIDANTHNIAMAWNCGLNAVIGGHVPTVSYQYAERVQNLVNTFKQQERAAMAAAPKVLPAPARPKSDFDLEFNEQQKPHFVLEDDSQTPLLVVNTEAPRLGLTVPSAIFALASTN